MLSGVSVYESGGIVLAKPSLHILIADDEVDLTYSLSFILEAAKYEVSTVAHARDALEKIREAEEKKRDIDLLITDVRMPDITGLQLAKTLREEGNNMPILVISEYDVPQTRREVNRLSKCMFLDKSVNKEVLLAKVAEMLKLPKY